MSLSTSHKSVEKLQNSLQAKAKSEPSCRFYSLWDKVYREDLLREAFRRSRANAGAPGVDGVDFEGIEFAGVDRWLKALQESPERGDIFVVQLPDESYLFGRVILAGMSQGSAPMPGANLIYIYAHRASTPTIDERNLLPGRLLIPPVWTNDLGWTKGCRTLESCERRTGHPAA